MTFTLPIVTVSEANRREHWSVRHRRKLMQQEAVGYAFLARRNKLPPPPVAVTLVRLGPGKIDDDNAVGALKWVRDAVAKFYGVNDGDLTKIRFVYMPPKYSKNYGVRFELLPIEGMT